MTVPITQKAWTIVPNIRITASLGLTGTMQGYLWTVKNLLINSASWTLKGSSANGTGAMDGVDRWDSASKILAGSANGVQGPWSPTGVLGDMAWACFTRPGAVGGGDLLVAWFGAGPADCCRISHSPGGLFVASTYHVSGGVCPTASDEIHFGKHVAGVNNQNNEILGGDQISGDRVINFWVDSTNSSVRFNVANGGGWVGVRWGLEQINSTVTGGSVVWSGSWGFWENTQAAASNNFSTYNLGNVCLGGQASCTLSAVFKQTQLVKGVETYNATVSTFTTSKFDTQGGWGYPFFPCSVAGLTTTTPTGKFGNLIDWWLGHAFATSSGELYGSKQFIIVGVSDGIVWPWDGTSDPQLA